MAIWLVTNGHARRLATLPIPDDVAVLRGRLLAATLGDGALWEVRPRLIRLVASVAVFGLLMLLTNR
jgi:hypothetical protein